MATVVLDANKWAQRIKGSPVLRTLLEDEEFLRAQVDRVLTIYKGGASIITLIKGFEFVLDDDQRVTDAVDGATNNSDERRSLLHWFAISVYASARELNLIRSRIIIRRR